MPLWLALGCLLLNACDGDALLGVGNVRATPGPGSVLVGWDDRSSGENGFDILRESTPTSTFEARQIDDFNGVLIATVPPNTEEFLDTTVVDGQIYRYAVVAFADGERSAIEADTISNPVEPDPIEIPDANLRAAILERLSLPPETDLTLADMERLVSLEAPSRGIRNLTGLEFAINLRELNLQDLGCEFGCNSIGDLRPLARLTALDVLLLSSVDVGDIGPLANLTGLTTLDLSFNDISDIGPLASLVSLRTLDLSFNGVSSVASLAGLVNLSALDLYSNNVADIGALVANPGLGKGDEIDLRFNCLDITDDVDPDLSNIGTLESRGATVLVDPQSSCF